MKPEICDQWEEVLSSWREVGELVKDEQLEEAASKAIFTFILGVRVTKALSDELEDRDLCVIAENAIGEWMEREPAWGIGGKHHTPKENIEWAHKTLKRLSDALPPDTFRPFQ
jgi:hypothetical protein